MTNTDPNSNVLPIPRDTGGRFAKGAPGRPKGAKGKARGTLEKIRSFGPEALTALHEAIIAKERWAVEYCLNKIVPGNARLVDWEGVEIDDIREAFKQGDISTSELKEIVTALEKIAAVQEWETLDSRIANLERVANDAK